MENEEALSCSMQSQLDESMQDTSTKPLPLPEKVCMMQGQASAEIVDEMTNNNSMHWPMNLEVKQEPNKDDDW